MAEKDLTDASDWYDRQRAGLGGEFLLELQATLDRICGSPEIYAPEYRNVRRAGLNRFPYFVSYRILGSCVEVLAVLHVSRHPRAWRSRA
jgi:plasmid stabilization system protein ParE